MCVTVREVTSHRDLKKFVKLPFSLYRKNKNWIPLLIRDEMTLFDVRKNPGAETSDLKLFLAFRDQKPVARVAAMINHEANRKYNVRDMRFGWFECENNPETAQALFDGIEKWAVEAGMESITGPMGFTDLDPEGILVEGFNETPTIASNYNFSYYEKLIRARGFVKEIDYIEFRVETPEDRKLPDKLLFLADRIRERSSFRVLHFKNRRQIMNRGIELLTLLDEAFDEVYGSVPLSEKQKHYYLKRYAACTHPELIKAVLNDKNEMVGFMVAMPSLTRGFRRAGGRLLPFGWYHISRSLKTYDTLDFYLAGVKKGYRGTGVDLLMLIEIAKTAINMGFRHSESNLELETNFKIHAMWKYFNPVQHKRRRIFTKKINADEK